MATTGDNLGLTIGETSGATGWNTWMDANHGILDAVVFLDVKSRTTAAPPGSPAAGDRYLVAASPTGAWSGQAGKIAVYRAAAWVFYTPKEGWLLTSQGDGAALFKYQSSAWVEINPYDIPCFKNGKPAASEIVCAMVFTRAVKLPASLTGSVWKAGTAATGSSAFDIRKNGSSIGTITFAAAGTTATFTFASAVSFASGDVLTILAPGTQDATLADLRGTLAGSLA